VKAQLGWLCLIFAAQCDKEFLPQPCALTICRPYPGKNTLRLWKILPGARDWR